MLLTSCSITPPGGSALEMIEYLLVKPTRFRFGALGEVSTATLEFIGVASTIGPTLVPGASVTVNSGESGSSGLFGEAIAGEAVFGEGGSTTGGSIFMGTITSVETKAVRVAASGTGYTRFTCQCQGLESYLLDTVVTADEVYSSQSDAVVIADILSTYLPSVSITNVSAVGTISLTVRAGWTIRQCLDEVIARTAAIYYMSGAALYFHADSASAAPFNIKESQDVGSGEIAPLWQNFGHTSSWANRANRVVVLGQASTGGVRVTATVDDATSQSTYGIISRTITDANITSTGEATARGNIELANFANPQTSGRFSTRTEGFSVGQSITITMPSEVIAEACFIRSVEWTWETCTDVTYAIDFGQFSANLVRRLQTILQDSKEKPYVTVGIPAPAVIAPTHFASTIEPVGVVTATPNGSQELAIALTQKIVYNTYDKKTYRWDTSTGTYRRRLGAGDLEADSVTAGTIAVGAIRAVDAVFDTAAIQTADIANAAITNAKIGSLAVDTAQIANAAITTAKIANLAVTSAQIANATITDAQIASATITSAKIASLDASKITAGTISASISVTAGTFTGSTLVLNSNGITTTVNNGAMSGGYAGVKVKYNSSSAFLTMGVATGLAQFAVYGDGGVIAGYLTTNGNAGFIDLLDSSGTSAITLDASANSDSAVYLRGSRGITTISGNIDIGGVYKMDSTTIIDASKNASFANIDASGSYKMDGSDIINTSGSFIGSAVNVSSGTVTCGGVTIGSNYAMRVGTSGKKTAYGTGQFSGGTLSVNTGLSSVDAIVGMPVSGTNPTEYVGCGTPIGGSVAMYSSNGSSSGFFFWVAVGSA